MGVKLFFLHVKDENFDKLRRGPGKPSEPPFDQSMNGC